MDDQMERLIRNCGGLCGDTTKLLQSIKTELSRDNASIGHLHELMANISRRKEALLEALLDLDQGIGQGTVMQSEEYKDRVISIKTRAHGMIQNAHESEGGVRERDANQPHR